MGWNCLSFCRRRDARAPADSPYRSTYEHGASRLFFADKYEQLELLGQGKTGRVFRVRPYQSPRFEAAAKIVRKDYLNTPQRQHAFKQELAILRRVRHPSVLKLFDVFEDMEQFVVVTERALGGDLLDVLCEQPAFQYRERDVAWIVRELLRVVAYLHADGVTHRDIKVDNILCRTSNVLDGIVLIDFGLAHRGGAGIADMTGMNGTCHYMAPEMFGRDSRYGCEIDMWAIGILTFVLLFGRYPFDGRFMSQVEDKILAGEYAYPDDLVEEVSPQALKFIEYLLVANPRERPPAAMALQHPWMQVEQVSPARFSDAHFAQLRSFHNASKGPSAAAPANAQVKR